MQDLLNLEKALARLTAIDWRNRKPMQHRRSNAMLMLEVLRREDIWRDAISSDDEERPGSLVDLARLINPLIRAPQDAIDALNSFRLTIHEPRLCEHYLHWAALEGMGKTAIYDLPEPYEPLMMIFERGGVISRESGWIEVGGASVRHHRPPLVELPDAIKELDIDYLNQLDFDWES